MKNILDRGLSLILILLLIFSGPISVFAQEGSTTIIDTPNINLTSANDPSQSTSTSEPIDITPLIPFSAPQEQTSILEQDQPSILEDNTLQDNNLNQIDSGQPQLNLLSEDLNYDTSHVVYEKTSPQTDLSGSLIYSYPIVTPPGRKNINPSLALIYNSSNHNNVNILGYGWDTNIPIIERINKRGTDNMYSDSYFTSTLSGELASTTQFGIYTARVEDGSFLKYIYSTTTGWTVYDKTGTRYTYGTTTTAQTVDPGNATHIAQWYLNEIRDTNGNFINYNYVKYGDQVYPSYINYTLNASSTGTIAGNFKVVFTYEDRSDDVNSVKWGFTQSNEKRLQKIEIYANSVLVKKYEFSYTTGVNGVRVMLDSATETGYDDNNSPTSLPSTSFDYTNGSENPTVAGGISDSLGSGGTFSGATTYFGPPLVGNVYADLNGDGYQDSFYARQPSSFESGYTINTLGNPVTSGSIPSLRFHQNDTQVDFGNRIVDLNGDGFLDFVGIPVGSDKTAYFSTASTTNNLEYISTTSPSLYPGLYEAGPPWTRIGDANGDGLPNSTTSTTYIIGYTDWNEDGIDEPILGDYPILLSYTDAYGNDTGVRIIDVNSDGLPDILQGIDSVLSGGHHGDIWINNGNGYAIDTTASSTIFITVTNHSTPGLYNYSRTDYYDTNGDGIIELPSIACKNRADYLKTITYPTGGATAVEYKPTTQFRDSNNQMLNPKLPNMWWAVSKITNSDGIGTSTISNYSYENGRGFYNNAYDRKFAGFEIISKTVGNQVTKTYYHQGNSNDSRFGETGDDYAKIGKPFMVEVYDANGRLFSRTENLYGTSTIANVGDPSGFVNSSPRYVFQSGKIEESYNQFDSTHKDKATEYVYSTTTGNVTVIKDWGEVISNSNISSSTPTFSDTGTDLASTTISYVSSTTPYIIGLISTSTTYDQSANKVKETRSYYDNLSIGNVNNGNETKRETWKNGSSYASTTKAYDGTYGLVTRSTDPNSNVTTYTIDSNNLYVATSTNAKNQTTGYTYDYASGKVKSTFDPNNKLYTTTYDAFRRPLTINIPDSTSGSLVTKTSYTYTDSGTPGSTKVQKTDNFNSSTSTNSYTYFDGLGRILQDRKQVEGDNTYSVKDRTYNNIGLVASESLPYFASSTSRSTATTTNALYANYLYDTLFRLATTVNAVGTTTTIYSGWTATTTDARGNNKTFIKDARDNLVNVVEYISTSTAYITTYQYDLNSNLTKITDASGNIRNFTYDGMSRRLSAEDLHAVGDSYFGTWSFSYDDVGNLTQKIDGKSQTINYTYDSLNRPLTEDYTGQSGTEMSYTYDGCSNGIGRVCTASSTGSLVSNLYNTLGLISEATSTINSTKFKTTYSYDRQGNKTFVLNPDNTQIGYEYNNAGLVEKVISKKSGSSASTTISTFDYSPVGQITTQVFGNGATTTNTYNQNQLYRLTNKVSTSTVGVLQNISYTYDGNGNITEMTNSTTLHTPKTISYSYDALNRLTRAVCCGTSISTSTSHVKVLVIGGGGGGGSGDTAGGGGGGGYQYDANLVISSGTHSVTIGSGGSGGVAGTGSSGGNSVFETITAIGGGGGGTHGVNGQNGSSGGGAGYDGSAGSGTGGQGTSGGTGAVFGSDHASGGGGGGAGVSGSNASGGFAGAGGNGTTSSITGSSVTYGGGGGGGGYDHSTDKSGAGGAGGGGAGASTGSAQNGTANLGGGGGGWGYGGSTSGGNGGSGVVIISYASDGSDGILASSTGGTITTSGGQRIHTFNSSGTFTAESVGDQSSGDPVGYTQTFTYDAIGNLLIKTENSTTTNYFYQGTTTSNYANPHAVTAIQVTASSSVAGHVKVLAIGGGGGGAGSGGGSGGGGGGGGYQYDSLHNVASQSYSVTVGSGGSGGGNNSSGFNGNDSIFDSITASGGAGGGKYGNSGLDGASGGGGGGNNNSGGSGTSGQGSNGGSGGVFSAGHTAGGGGGGAGVAGGNASNPNGGNGGNGLSNSISGASATYAGGGGGGKENIGDVVGSGGTGGGANGGNTTGNNGTANLGGGGGGAGGTDGIAHAGGNGGSGVVIISYASDGSDGILASSTGGTITTSGGQRIHTFNSSGTFTVEANSGGASSNYTETFTYDQNGNLTSRTGGLATSTYDWDYSNRLASTSFSGISTQYGYDYVGQRVKARTMSTTTQTFYPSTTYNTDISTTGTTTAQISHIFSNDLLLGTIASSTVASTTPTYHILDHLGSTQVSLNQNGTVTEVSDYFPFGYMRFNEKGQTQEQRKYIGQEYDVDTRLSYLNARCYEGSRGQFLSQDPMFWGVGNTKVGRAMLSDPQSMNSYSYAGNNPINNKDPQGLWYKEFITGQQSWSSFYGEVGQAAYQMGQDNSGWNFAMNHPYATGGVVAALSYPALQSGLAAGVAFKAAGDAGVGAAYAAKQIFAGTIYSILTYGTTARTIPETIGGLGNVNFSNPSSALSWGTSFAWNVGPSLAGEYVGAFSDAIQLGGMISKSLGSAATNLFSNSIQTRTSAVNSFNSSIGGTGSSQPSNNSLWVTPSGAVVNWGGSLVSGPVKK